MVDGHFRHLPVVNDDGHVIGLASMRDLMAYTSLRLRQRQHGHRRRPRPGRGDRDDPPHAHRRGVARSYSYDLPDAAAQHRHPLAAAGDAGDVHVVVADHEVDVDLAAVDPLDVVARSP